jgi:hypothetical protein
MIRYFADTVLFFHVVAGKSPGRDESPVCLNKPLSLNIALNMTLQKKRNQIQPISLIKMSALKAASFFLLTSKMIRCASSSRRILTMLI